MKIYVNTEKLSIFLNKHSVRMPVFWFLKKFSVAPSKPGNLRRRRNIWIMPSGYDMPSRTIFSPFIYGNEIPNLLSSR